MARHPLRYRQANRASATRKQKFLRSTLKKQRNPPLTMCMTAHDPNLSREPGGLLSWLGFGGGDSSAGEPVPHSTPESGQADGREDRRERRRRQLLEDISSSLLTHRLQVSSETLTIAYTVMTGGNPKMARLIEERV
jgi:hypothetical protein